jgi:predicted MFS family arabinose efflux permease
LLDPVGWLLVVLCVVSLVAFVFVERRSPAPMVKPAYFARRAFTLPMVSSGLVQFAYMGGFVITPALLEGLYGWAVGAVALLLALRPAAFSISSPVGGQYAVRVGEKPPIVLGAVSMTVSMSLFAVASLVRDGTGIALIVGALILTGFSAGISQPAVISMVVGAVDPEDMGIASGMNQQVMFIGIVVGIQTMNVLVGDGTSAPMFFATFVIGVVAAVLALVAALAIRRPGPATT